MMYILQPLLRAKVFEPGPKLTCSASAVTYCAELGANGEIKCLCGCSETFRSPSAFSVHIKRKVNPGRKADDGWTSIRYMGTPLGAYRAQLEELLSKGKPTISSDTATDGSDNTVLLTQVMKQKRKARTTRFGHTLQPGLDRSGTADGPKYTRCGTAVDVACQFSSEDPTPATACSNRPPQQQESTRQLSNIAASQPQRWRTSGLPRSSVLQGTSSSRQHMQLEADLQDAWLRCSNPDCRKWRQVQYTGEAYPSNWTCSDSNVAGQSDCSIPQQLPDYQVQLLLRDAAGKRFAAASNRPPLLHCTQQAFEEDLCAFLASRGDEQLAALVRDSRITCNNSPLDVFGLYGEVVKRGGLLENERYDERGRWAGGINFAGDIFPRLKNFTPNNRATSVGNQLLNNYKKFLLAYECAYRSRDLFTSTESPPTAVEAGGCFDQTQNDHILKCEGAQSSKDASGTAAADGGSGSGGEESDWPAESGDGLDDSTQVAEPLCVLAAAALQQQDDNSSGSTAHDDSPEQLDNDGQQHSDRGSQERPAKRQRAAAGSTGQDTSMTAAAELAVVAPVSRNLEHLMPLQQQQQQQHAFEQQQQHACEHQHHQQHICHQRGIQGSAEYIIRLQAAAALALKHAAAPGGHAWCLPGSLLLVKSHINCCRDPRQQQQNILPVAAVVADISQLPAQLAAAAVDRPTVTAQTSDGTFASASRAAVTPSSSSTGTDNSSDNSQVLPVLLLGSKHLCWVRKDCCKPFSAPEAQTVLLTAWQSCTERTTPASAACGRVKYYCCSSCCSLSVVGCSSSNRGISCSTLEAQQQQQMERLQGLKQALQWAVNCSSSSSSTSWAGQQSLPTPSRWVTAAGSAAVAADLLQLEAQLPVTGVSSSSSMFWESWREAVQTATTPEQLAHQVLMLAYQCEAQLIKPAISDTFWPELHKLLGIAQGAPSRAQQQQLQHLQQEQQTSLPLNTQCTASEVLQIAAAVDTVGHGVEREQSRCCMPEGLVTGLTVLSVSEAVRVLQLSLDWHVIRQLWQAGPSNCHRNAHPGSAAAGNAAVGVSSEVGSSTWRASSKEPNRHGNYTALSQQQQQQLMLLLTQLLSSNQQGPLHGLQQQEHRSCCTWDHSMQQLSQPQPAAPAVPPVHLNTVQPVDDHMNPHGPSTWGADSSAAAAVGKGLELASAQHNAALSPALSVTAAPTFGVPVGDRQQH